VNKKLRQFSKHYEDKEIYNINSVICFNSGSTYDFEQLTQPSKHLWFRVLNEDNIIEYVEEADSNEFYLKDKVINALINDMNLNKIDINRDIDKLSIDNKSQLSNNDINIITERIHIDFSKKTFTLVDLSDIVQPEIAVRYLKEATLKKILIGSDGAFILNDKWMDRLPKVKEEKDEDSYDLISQFSKEDFWLKPKKSMAGCRYLGPYRGTAYHVNYKGETWWRKGKTYPKIMAKFSDDSLIEEILEIKPQGGSFKITESKELITKVFTESEGYIPVYIGKYSGNIEFQELEWKPKGIKKGDLWPSIYDGTTLSINSNKGVHIKIGGQKSYALDGHDQLADMILKYQEKSEGGRFKINENGAIITLMYQAPYPTRIKNQLNKLSNEEKNLIDIRNNKYGDGMVPIYIGTFKGNIKFQKLFNLHAEWTKEDDDKFLKRMFGE